MRLVNLQACGGLALLIAAFAASAPVMAQEATEKERLKQCEIDICSALAEKKREGGDVTCNLEKTWAKEEISQEASEKKLPWELGDAKCGLNLKLDRAGMVNAVEQPEYTLKIAEQKVNCEVEQGGTKYPVSLTLAPELKFKGGEAIEALLGVGNIEAPTVIKGVIWSAAALEQNFGIFHGDILKEVNKFISKKCPKTLAEKK